MAVSKELLARYKELKAQGINIPLAELKTQMEAEHTAQNASFCEPLPPPENKQNIPLEHSITQSISYEQTKQNQITEDSVQIEPQHQFSGSQSMPNSSQSCTQSDTPAFVSSFTQGFIPAQTQEQQTSNNTQENQIQKPEQSWEFQQTPTLTTPSIESYSQAQGFSIAQPVQTNAGKKYTGNITEQMIQSINTQTQTAYKYCLIGYPLGHSLSTYIHNAGFKSLGLNYTYEILETPTDTLVDRIKYLKHNNFAGFNVTIPLKLPVTLFLDEIDASADIVGAVNTVIIRPDKTLKGYNTDVIGFYNAIPKDFTIAGKTVGVLGTGGAARAAITALAQNQAKHIKIYTRNVPNSIELLNFLRSKFPNIEFNAFQIEHIRDLSDIKLLVNTTPIGMQGRGADYTPVEEEQLRTLEHDAIVYDVIYNPKKTILLKLAQKNGYRTINGVDMFIHQAVAAQQIWTGRTPDFKDMKIAALENL